jgi:hypothetical protein
VWGWKGRPAAAANPLVLYPTALREIAAPTNREKGGGKVC